MGKIRTKVYSFNSSDLHIIENQQIYEYWANTEEGKWVIKHALDDLEIKEEDVRFAFDQGGNYPVGSTINVYALFDEKNYLLYKLKWTK